MPITKNVFVNDVQSTTSRRTKLIAFVHHKGGTGKTTSCINVAAMKDLFDVEGIRDYIVKPFENQDLLLRVSRVLKNR